VTLECLASPDPESSAVDAIRRLRALGNYRLLPKEKPRAVRGWILFW
jgi:hypothetical protein